MPTVLEDPRMQESIRIIQKQKLFASMYPALCTDFRASAIKTGYSRVNQVTALKRHGVEAVTKPVLVAILLS